jgi:predicted transposase/invertase (TIGR01784 family)
MLVNSEWKLWMEFIGAKSKGAMKMLAEKNKDIGKADDILTVMSKNEKARMAYEAREAEIHDQVTREKVAREEGREEGREKEKVEIAKTLLDVLDDETISLKTGLTIEQVKKMRS